MRKHFSRPANASCLFLIPLLIVLVSACSFDYENSDENALTGIVLTMRDMEYVSIRGGDPSVRIRAEEARRYEDKHSMELDVFSFEQFESAGQRSSGQGESTAPGISTRGRAGRAQIELDTGNLSMNGGVFIEAVTDDIAIETIGISWRDKEKALSAPGEVTITRSDGTVLSGRGLSADIRSKTWELRETVEGNMVDTIDEETN
jgi:LPS export ABC transporter protein LptC